MNATSPPDRILPRPDAASEPPFAWLGELHDFFRRYWRTVLVCLALAVALAGCYLATAPRRFTASATLLIDTRQADLVGQHAAPTDAQIENAVVESDVEVLRSPALARRTVASLHLADDRDFSPTPSLLSRLLGPLRSPSRTGADSPGARDERLAQQFGAMVSAHRIGLTYVVEIDATASTPTLAARLANGLARAYVAEQLDTKAATDHQASGWIDTELASLRDRALAADRTVETFRAKSGLVETGHGTLDEEQIAQLDGQLAAARARTADALARLDRIRQRPAADGAVSDVLKSPVINTLRERYLADEQRLAEWTGRYGAGHDAAVQMRAEMAALQNSIDDERHRIEQATASDLAVDRAGEAALQRQLDALVARSATADVSRATLRSLQSTADTYRSLYAAFLQRAMQVEQGVSFPVSDARVITAAVPPLNKSQPKNKLVLMAAVVLGLGAGFAVGLGRELLDRRIRTPADLLARTGVPCIARLSVMPRSSPVRLPGLNFGFGLGSATPPTPSGAVASSPGSTVRRLLLRLRLCPVPGRAQTIGLVSPFPVAGTGTIVDNLLMALAAFGRTASALELTDPLMAGSQLAAGIETLHRGGADAVVVNFPPLSEPSPLHLALGTVDRLLLVLPVGRITAEALEECWRAAELDPALLSGAVLVGPMARA